MAVKKRKTRSVERQRDVQRQHVKSDKEATSQQQVSKQNITIKIGEEMLSRAKKRKPRKRSSSRKKQLIANIKAALQRFQELKKLAEERKVKIPAALGILPQEADKMNTIAELQSLLQTIQSRNNELTEMLEKAKQPDMEENIFAQGAFGSGGTFPASYRLPTAFPQQPAPPIVQAGVISAPASAVPVRPAPVVPAPAPKPVAPAKPKSTDSRAVKPPQGEVGAEQQRLIRDIDAIRKRIARELKKKLDAGEITQDEYRKGLADATKAAKEKNQQFIKSFMSAQASKDYDEIQELYKAYIKRIKLWNKPDMSPQEEISLKDQARTLRQAIRLFKINHPKLVNEHPEVFAFTEYQEVSNADPVALIAQNTGKTITVGKGRDEAAITDFNGKLRDLNQSATNLNQDFQNSGDLSQSEIKEFQRRASELQREEDALAALANEREAIGVEYVKRENKEILAKVNKVIRVVMALQYTPPVKPQKDMGIQMALYRLLAYTAGRFQIGREYDKSTFNADLYKINSALPVNPDFQKEKDNGGEQKNNVRQAIENFFIGAPDGLYDRQYEGKPYQIGKGGQPSAPSMGGNGRRMIGRGSISQDLPVVGVDIGAAVTAGAAGGAASQAIEQGIAQQTADRIAEAMF